MKSSIFKSIRPESKIYRNREANSKFIANTYLSPIETEIESLYSRGSRFDFLDGSLNLRSSPIPRSRGLY